MNRVKRATFEIGELDSEEIYTESPTGRLNAAKGRKEGRGAGHLFKIEMMLLCNSISPADDDLSSKEKLQTALLPTVIRWRCRIAIPPSLPPLLQVAAIV